MLLISPTPKLPGYVDLMNSYDFHTSISCLPGHDTYGRVSRLACLILAFLKLMVGSSVAEDHGLVIPPQRNVVEQKSSLIHDRPVPIRVVAYNVHLLPDIASRIAGKRRDSAYRAKAIGKRLKKFDLIGISEAFDRGDSNNLLTALQSEGNAQFSIANGPARSGRHLIGSGLMLLSRWPIEQTHLLTYSHASRFLTSGFKADGFAAKGALHVRLRLGDEGTRQLDCFLTHLESRSVDARAKQIEEFQAFVAKHASIGVPALLMGDFNVTADASTTPASQTNDSPYQRLHSALSFEQRQLIDVAARQVDGPFGTSDALSRDGNRRIDYIFVSNPASQVGARLIPQQTFHLPMLDENVAEGSLSDHAAVACHAVLRRR